MCLTVPGAFAEPLDTVRGVLIAVLLISEPTVEKLAACEVLTPVLVGQS